MGSLMAQVVRVRSIRRRVDEAWGEYIATPRPKHRDRWMELVDEWHAESAGLASMLDASMLENPRLEAMIAGIDGEVSSGSL